MLKIRKISGCLLFLAVTGSLLVSCEDVINVNLNDASPRIVIQGSISNISDSVVVILHRSTDFFKPENIAPVTDANVSITDNNGTLFNLSGRMNGSYNINHIHASPGDIFSLKVISDGNQYTASATMPYLVRIDTAFVDDRPGHMNENRLNIVFHDPAGIANYYQVKIYKNNILLEDYNRFRLYSDKYFDGRTNTITINARRFDLQRFDTNDTIKVQLINIEKAMYNYYQILGDITNSENFISVSTPSNPPNNLSNGALGYFAAWSVSEKKVIVK